MPRRYYTDRYGRQRRLRAEGIIPARVYDAGERYSQTIAEEVAAEINRTAPLRKMRYRNKDGGWTVETEAPGTLAGSFEVRDTERGAVIVTDVPYWQFVEFGTREHGPEQAYVRRALEVVRARHRNAHRRRLP